MTVATLALLAHPASALGGATPPIDDTWGLHSPPIVTHNIGTPVILDDGTVVYVIFPPITVGDGELTVGAKPPGDIYIGYKNPDGSFVVDVNVGDITISYQFDFDNGKYYFHGDGNTSHDVTKRKTEVHVGLHLTDNWTVGVFYNDGIKGGESGIKF